jgi:hypothetical protein
VKKTDGAQIAVVVTGFIVWLVIIRLALNQPGFNEPSVSQPAFSHPDLHLVQEVTSATYETDVLPKSVDTPTLIWFVRPDRASVFESDASTMERAAETWQGFVRFVRVNVTKVKRGSRMDQDLSIHSTAMTFMLLQVNNQDVHHHDLYKFHNSDPLAAFDIQDQILNFKPDCPRSQCPLCKGEMLLGRRPAAWR